MVNYYWRGTDLTGKVLQGYSSAPNLTKIKETLRQRGVDRVRLFKVPNIQAITARSIPASQITLFIRQLSTLLSSGLNLARALEGIISGISNPQLKKMAEEILLELQNGDSFSKILARRDNYFDNFIIHLISSGESSGNLALLLERAAEHREKNRLLQQKLWKALSYPLGVFVFTLMISLFLLLQVVPQFEILFHNLGGELPPLTKKILDLTHFLKEYLFELLAIVAATVVTAVALYRTNLRVKTITDRILLSLPISGSSIKEVTISRLSRTLSTLQEAAIPLHIGLATAAKMTSNTPLQNAIKNIHASVIKGISLSNAIADETLFPPIAVQMVRAGEESGDLPLMLAHLANYYEKEVEQRISQLTTLIEPLLILLIGGMVGVLAIALYQPIFQIGHHI